MEAVLGLETTSDRLAISRLALTIFSLVRKIHFVAINMVIDSQESYYRVYYVSFRFKNMQICVLITDIKEYRNWLKINIVSKGDLLINSHGNQQMILSIRCFEELQSASKFDAAMLAMACDYTQQQRSSYYTPEQFKLILYL